MCFKKRNQRSNKEIIIGTVDQKKKRELKIVVNTTLPTLEAVELGLGGSMIAPGSYVVINGCNLSTAEYEEGDKVCVVGTFSRRRYTRPSIYSTDEAAAIRKLGEIEARKMIFDEMMKAARMGTHSNTNNNRGNARDFDHKNYGNLSFKDMMQKIRNGEYVGTATYIGSTTYKQFVSTYTPSRVEAELNTRIVGQEGLTKAAADFLYYHALRQIKSELPPRPMLISGPSGSGKTEVWRVAKKLFGHVFNIEIIDGASITQEGWKGNNKLSSHIDQEMAAGGILIIDEFDKLAKPEYESNGSNIAARIQSEFLKLLEGEYVKKENNKSLIGRLGSPTDPSSPKIDTKKMGIVLVGAFEDIKAKRQSRVGFGAQSPTALSETKNITDEEYIEFGVLPELIGRVATKVTTNQLSDDEYIQIIHNPYSRVSSIVNSFKEFGVCLADVISKDEMRDLIKRSKSNKTGVRWVSAQIEGKMLETIRDIGVGNLLDEKEAEELENKPTNYTGPSEGEDEFFF